MSDQMGEKDAWRVAGGWRLTSALSACEDLVLGMQAPAEPRQLFLARVRGREVIDQVALRAANPKRDGEFLSFTTFTTAEGISVISPETGAVDLVMAADWKEVFIPHWWFVPGSRSFYFIQLARGEGDRGAWSVPGLLAHWDARKKARRIVRDFGDDAPTVSADISWRQGALFACLGYEVVRVDLRTGEMKAVFERTGMGLVVSPRDTLVTWGPRTAIDEHLPDGNLRRLTNSGMFPAFSASGQWMAFTLRDSQIWLKADGRQATLLLQLPENTKSRLSEPNWCSCGDHFAIGYIPFADCFSWVKQFVLVFDVAERSIFAYDSNFLCGGAYLVLRQARKPPMGQRVAHELVE